MAGKILFVDDEPAIVKVTAFRLRQAGYEVSVAGNGKEALELLRDPLKRPGLILLDLSMPVMDGYQACKLIKGSPDLKDIPVVFFTASNSMVNIEEQVKEFGAADYIVKPFEPQELLEKISRHIK